MIINYSNEPVRKDDNSIFLAGPTPRSKDVYSWRNDAIELLSHMNFKGTIFVPENSDGSIKTSYIDQTLWEREALETAGVIVFWIPRNLETMPAFTTNVEFGTFIHSGKIIYGRPLDTPKNKYLDWLYEYEYGKLPFENLQDTLREAVETLKEEKRVRITSLEDILEKILEDSDDFYERVFRTMTLDERTLIKKRLINKTCEQCTNFSCTPCVKVKACHTNECDYWTNDMLVGKSKVLEERNVMKLIKK